MARQTIVDNIKARCETITKVNGYSFNLNGLISIWRLTDIQESETYWIDIRDTGVSKIDEDNFSHYKALTVELRIYAQNGDSTASNLRTLVKDVSAAIKSDLSWSGYAYDTEYVSDEMTLEQQTQIAGMITLTVLVKYDTKKWED